MRIRTDGEYAHREDTIQQAAERLDCNKTRAVLISCDVVGQLLDNVEEVLEHEALPPRLRDDLAETISTHKVEIEVTKPEASVQIE